MSDSDNRPTRGIKLGMALTKALGLEGRKIKEITLHVSATGAATASYVEYVTVAHEGELVKVFDMAEPLVQHLPARETPGEIDLNAA